MVQSRSLRLPSLLGLSLLGFSLLGGCEILCAREFGTYGASVIDIVPGSGAASVPLSISVSDDWETRGSIVALYFAEVGCVPGWEGESTATLLTIEREGTPIGAPFHWAHAYCGRRRTVWPGDLVRLTRADFACSGGRCTTTLRVELSAEYFDGEELEVGFGGTQWNHCTDGYGFRNDAQIDAWGL